MSEIYYGSTIVVLSCVMAWYLWREKGQRYMAKTKAHQNFEAHLRMMTISDLPRIVEIEHECFNEPWSLKEFRTLLKDEDHLCGVAVVNERVVGYIIYEMKKSAVYLKCLAVAPAYRRKGVGRKMIKQMEELTVSCNRFSIRIHVAETNLLAQKFFRAVEFKAKTVCRNFYQEMDAYYFIKRFPVPAGVLSVTKANG